MIRRGDWIVYAAKIMPYQGVTPGAVGETIPKSAPEGLNQAEGVRPP